MTDAKIDDEDFPSWVVSDDDKQNYWNARVLKADPMILQSRFGCLAWGTVFPQ
jgi:hypothetical protein